MAEAIIRVRDFKGVIDVEVMFSPAIDEKSPAHELVKKFIRSAGLEMVEAKDEPAKNK